MNSEESQSMPQKMSSRKFVGLWALGGCMLGVVLAPSTYGDFASMLAYKVGTGLPFALVGAALGAAVQYCFRSDKNK
jgi:hypothetical protein